MKILIHRKRVIALLAVLMGGVFAMNADDEIVSSISFSRIPLRDALTALTQQAGINIILDPRVPGSGFGPGGRAAEPKVTLNVTNTTAKAALNKLLQDLHLKLVSNPATTVGRIVPVDADVSPAPAGRMGSTNDTAPDTMIFDTAPMDAVLTALGKQAGLKLELDPAVTAPAFANQGTINIRWTHITARQALAALVDNYGLVLSEDAATSTARITLAPKSTEAK